MHMMTGHAGLSVCFGPHPTRAQQNEARFVDFARKLVDELCILVPDNTMLQKAQQIDFHVFDSRLAGALALLTWMSMRPLGCWDVSCSLR